MLALTELVTRLQARLDAEEASEDDRRELLRLTIREAVAEAVDPVTERLVAVEGKVRAASWVAGGIATVLGPVAGWVLPKLIPMVPVLFIWGCGMIPVPKTPRPVDEICTHLPGTDSELLAVAERKACERAMNAQTHDGP